MTTNRISKFYKSTASTTKKQNNTVPIAPFGLVRITVSIKGQEGLHPAWGEIIHPSPGITRYRIHCLSCKHGHPLVRSQLRFVCAGRKKGTCLDQDQGMTNAQKEPNTAPDN